MPIILMNQNLIMEIVQNIINVFDTQTTTTTKESGFLLTFKYLNINTIEFYKFDNKSSPKIIITITNDWKIENIIVSV